MTQKEEREIFHLLIHSESSYNSQGWTRPKAGAWNSVWVTHKGGKGLENLDHLLPLSQGAGLVEQGLVLPYGMLALQSAA